MHSKKRRALVAGGAGFVGSNLVRRLLRRGYTVDCVDNLSTGTIQNVQSLFSEAKFRWVEADITSRELMGEIEATDYSEVYNLACPTGVPNIATMGEKMLLTSSLGSANLLRIARRSDAKYLFTSSAEVYGDPKETPQREIYNGNVSPVGPRSAYEEAKRFGEALTVQAAKAHGIDARIIRVFNTYGPAMSLRETRAIPAILRSLISGNPVTVYGNGRNTRCYLYVDDLLAGFELTMQVESQGDVYNIGADKEVSVLQLVEKCGKATGNTPIVAHLPHFIEDHHRRSPDTSKIRSLGWRPTMSLESGLVIAARDLESRLTHRGSDRRKAPRPIVPIQPAFVSSRV